MSADNRNRQETLDESIAVYQQAIDSGNCSLENHTRLGMLLQQKQLNQQAASQYSKALEIAPENAGLHFRLGTVLHAVGEFESAARHYHRASQLRPDFHDAIAGEAIMLAAAGDKLQACSLLRPLIESGTENIHIAASFAELCVDSGNREAVISLIEKILVDKTGASHGREKGLFALGNLYDGAGNYERAFEYFRQANDLHPSGYNPAEHEAEINSLISAYNPELLRRPNSGGANSDMPVFIVGMPRSGTSLVEQILSSHPSVAGCGELTLMGGLVKQLQQVLGSDLPYPECVRELQAPVVRSAAETYLGFVKRKSAGAERSIDKMPENYLHLGFINQILPNARIIHCIRDPLDTCLSCYFLRLNQRDYSYRLEHLGHYYKCYRQLMTYWARETGLAIMDVQYEKLVENPEKMMRDLIEFCGLDWDERCKVFYKEKRVVRTASYEQARKPIYGSSVGRAGNYKKFLAPLIDVIENQPVN